MDTADRIAQGEDSSTIDIVYRWEALENIVETQISLGQFDLARATIEKLATREYLENSLKEFVRLNTDIVNEQIVQGQRPVLAESVS